MPANVMHDNKIVTIGRPAWHDLGLNFQTPMSAVQAIEAMGGAFEIFLKQVGVMFDDQFVSVKNNFAIVRGPTNMDNAMRVFGFCTDHYTPIQPIAIAETFDKRVAQSIETWGFIGAGEKMFATWALPSIMIAGEDEVKLYGTILVGFDGKFSVKLNIGTVRVVCENTFNMALGEADAEKGKNRGRGTMYSGKHTNKNLLGELGSWMGHIQNTALSNAGLVGNFFQKMAEVRMDETHAWDLVYQTWPDPKPVSDFYPDELRKKKQESIDVLADERQRIRNGVYANYIGSEGIAISETYWGLFNAGTQYFNHDMPSKKATAYSIVFGDRSKEMNLFSDVLMQDIYQ